MQWTAVSNPNSKRQSKVSQAPGKDSCNKTKRREVGNNPRTAESKAQSPEMGISKGEPEPNL